jgi:hypothetical protein
MNIVSLCVILVFKSGGTNVPILLHVSGTGYCVFLAWGWLELHLLASCLGRSWCRFEKLRIGGQPIVSNPQRSPKLTQNINPIKVELLCHSCVDCCMFHLSKSILLHDFVEAKHLFFQDDLDHLQCIELLLNRSLCISLVRIVWWLVGEFCVEHKQTHLTRTSTHLTTNISPYVGCPKDRILTKRDYPPVDDLYVQCKRESDGCGIGELSISANHDRVIDFGGELWVSMS